MSEVTKKPHYVRIQVQSVSDGVENQILDVTEGAKDSQELVDKCFIVTDGITAAMKTMAKAGGYSVDTPGNAPLKK